MFLLSALRQQTVTEEVLSTAVARSRKFLGHCPVFGLQPFVSALREQKVTEEVLAAAVAKKRKNI